MVAALPYTYGTATVAAGIVGTFDWDNSVCHLITAGPTLHDFSMVPRAELAVVNLFSLPSYNLTNFDALCTAKDGRIYFSTGDGNHLFVGYNPQTQTFDRNYVNLGLGASGYLTSFIAAVHQYVIGAAVTSGVVGSQINVVDMTASVGILTQSFNVTEHATGIQPGNARVCQGATFGIVAALDGFANAFIGFYNVTPTTNTRVGQLTSVAVDGSAAFTAPAFGTPVYDATDGNIMLCVNTAISSYLVKVNAATGALIWKIAITGMVDLNECRIAFGQLQMIIPGTTPWRWYTINTSAGTITTNTTEPVLANFLGLGVWSDKIQLLISSQNNSPGPSNWATFGPPPGPPRTNGGVLRNIEN